MVALLSPAVSLFVDGRRKPWVCLWDKGMESNKSCALQIGRYPLALQQRKELRLVSPNVLRLRREVMACYTPSVDCRLHLQARVGPDPLAVTVTPHAAHSNSLSFPPPRFSVLSPGLIHSPQFIFQQKNSPSHPRFPLLSVVTYTRLTFSAQHIIASSP